MILLELTAREWDVLVELCRDGANNRMIASRLFVVEDTVKVHIKNILKKSPFSSRTELAVAVLRQEVELHPRAVIRAK